MNSRLKLSEQLSDKLLFECNRTCCVCNIPGKVVQVHHIDKNPSNNNYENIIVLCLNCHSEVHTIGGFGKNWTIGQLRKHKEEWVERVKLRKQEADKIASIQTVTGDLQNAHDIDELDYKEINSPVLKRYLEKILIVHKAQKEITQLDFNTGVTWDTINACNKMVDFYETILIELSSFYPSGHFQNKHPKIFFSEQIAARGIFQSYATRPDGIGFIPTMYRQFMSYRYMRDVRMMVRDIAVALIDMSGQYEPDESGLWEKAWMKD